MKIEEDNNELIEENKKLKLELDNLKLFKLNFNYKKKIKL